MRGTVERHLLEDVGAGARRQSIENLDHVGDVLVRHHRSKLGGVRPLNRRRGRLVI
jgi:hypothetical protein